MVANIRKILNSTMIFLEKVIKYEKSLYICRNNARNKKLKL